MNILITGIHGSLGSILLLYYKSRIAAENNILYKLEIRDMSFMKKLDLNAQIAE